jgi:hypothetical protein
MSQKNNFESPQCPENSSSKGAKSRDKKWRMWEILSKKNRFLSSWKLRSQFSSHTSASLSKLALWAKVSSYINKIYLLASREEQAKFFDSPASFYNGDATKIWQNQFYHWLYSSIYATSLAQIYNINTLLNA